MRIPYTILTIALLVSSFCLTAVLLKLSIPMQTVSMVASAYKTSEIQRVPEVTFLPPSRLEIANINVNSMVKPVGLTGEGNMAIDDNINDVAWYELGPKPGEPGSSVIAGHYGWKNGQASIFTNLHTLKAGDKVSVYDVNAKPLTFIVKKTEVYEPNADATEVFKSSDGKSHLNLITCEGSWNSNLQTYSQRLVVFTDIEGSI